MTNYNDKVAIIGIGRLGSALAQALYRSQYLIAGLIDQDLSRAKRVCNLVAAKICSRHIFAVPKVDIIFICVPDDAIDSVVANLTSQFERNRISKYLFHCSGALTSQVFDPLKKFDVACASFHPIQTLAGQESDWENLHHIYYGLEGDRKAIDKAAEIIQTFDSQSITIPTQYKSLYHLACTMASNYLISLMVPVVEAFQKMNFSEQQTLTILDPLLTTTISNLKKQGIESALTGPISRGDFETIKKHLDALAQNLPMFETIYKVHGRLLLDLGGMREKMSQEDYEALSQLLDEQGLNHD